MAILKNTTIQGTNSVTLPKGRTFERPSLVTTVQSFTSVGTSSWTAPDGVSAIEVLVVAGGGGGASNLYNGGGGAGGLIYRSNYPVVSGNSYTVTVGGGGAVNNSGSNSVFDSLTAIGGGRAVNGAAGSSGGSGGGGAYNGNNTNGYAGGAGTVGQGNAGGEGGFTPGFGWGGGGGGAGMPGASARASSTFKSPGSGGDGLEFSISGAPTWYAGGGGGHIDTTGSIAEGGRGGGGRGSDNRAPAAVNTNGVAGTANTGGGGGWNSAGGSGIVIIKYVRLSDNSDPTGLIRYNTDFDDLEIYENNAALGWIAQDARKNFAGHNQLRYSQDFTQAAYTLNESTVSPNVTTAPDGTSTATKFIPNGNLAAHYILNDSSIVQDRWYVGSIFAKASELRYLQAAPSSGFLPQDAHVNFDLISGTFSIQGTNTDLTSAQIIDAGNGWYRCVCIAKGKSNTNGRIAWNTASSLSAGRLEQTTGNGSDGLFIWGMQLEAGVAVDVYTPTGSAGSPPPSEIAGYRIHTFTGIGETNFIPSCSGNVEVLVVGGGGGGAGGYQGGGGGAGGVIYRSNYPVISNQKYKVIVGGGGVGAVANAGGFPANGDFSQFGTLYALGGGAGATQFSPGGSITARAGGSGGGGSHSAGEQPGAGSPGQGNRGGVGYDPVPHSSGGGGGAGSPGEDGWNDKGGNGGRGLEFTISGSSVYYGGGGGGSYRGPNISQGGLGGGGNSGLPVGQDGLANTGGGGGAGRGADYGGSNAGAGGSGGSGVVIVRYGYKG